MSTRGAEMQARRSLVARAWSSPTVTSWGSLAVRLGGMVLLLPIVLVRFDPADVAVWQLLATLTALALMLDFGLAPTFVRLLSYARGGASLQSMRSLPGAGRVELAAGASTDPPAAPALLGALRWLYPRLALGAGVLFGLFGAWALMLPLSAMADPSRGAWAGVATWVGAIAILWGGGAAAALQGLGHLAVQRRWEAGVGMAQVTTALLALLAGADVLGLVLVQQAWAVIGAVVQRRLLHRLVPDARDGGTHDRRAVLGVLWPPAWRSGLGVLLSHGMVQASGVAYSQLATPAEAASYLLALRVMALVSQFSQVPFYSRLPDLGRLFARGDRDALWRTARRGLTWSYAVYVLGSLSVAFAIGPLLRLMDSRTEFVAPGIWALLSLAVLAERYGAMHLQLHSLGNRILWHIGNGVSALIMLAVALTAYPSWTLAAFPAALLVAYAGFYAPFAAVNSRRLLGASLGRLDRVTALPALGLLGAGLAAAWAWTAP